MSFYIPTSLCCFYFLINSRIASFRQQNDFRTVNLFCHKLAHHLVGVESFNWALLMLKTLKATTLLFTYFMT